MSPERQNQFYSCRLLYLLGQYFPYVSIQRILAAYEIFFSEAKNNYKKSSPLQFLLGRGRKVHNFVVLKRRQLKNKNYYLHTIFIATSLPPCRLFLTSARSVFKSFFRSFFSVFSEILYKENCSCVTWCAVKCSVPYFQCLSLTSLSTTVSNTGTVSNPYSHTPPFFIR